MVTDFFSSTTTCFSLSHPLQVRKTSLDPPVFHSSHFTTDLSFLKEYFTFKLFPSLLNIMPRSASHGHSYRNGLSKGAEDSADASQSTAMFSGCDLTPSWSIPNSHGPSSRSINTFVFGQRLTIFFCPISYFGATQDESTVTVLTTV